LKGGLPHEYYEQSMNITPPGNMVELIDEVFSYFYPHSPTNK